MLLGMLQENEKAEVIGFVNSVKDKHKCRDHNQKCKNLQSYNIISRLESMGIRKGKHVEMISNNNKGPLLVKVDEHRIALGRGMADQIEIEKILREKDEQS
jgi:Fe2+ transport system protein FeoA